jgi:hypothetical protein
MAKSLADCVKQIGEDLSQYEKDALLAKAESYADRNQKGYKAVDPEVQAVQDALDEVEAERADILRQVGEATAKKGEEVEGKEQPGLVRIAKLNKTVPFTEYREITKGKNKGKVQVKYQGRNHVLDREMVSRWPAEPAIAKVEAPAAEAVEVKATPEGPVVSTDLTAKEEKTLTLKEQKAYLLAEIDKAIEQAPEKPRGRISYQPGYQHLATEEEGPSKITIKVPGGPTYNLTNYKSELRLVRKEVEKIKTDKPGRSQAKGEAPTIEKEIRQALELYGDKAPEIIQRQSETVDFTEKERVGHQKLIAELKSRLSSESGFIDTSHDLYPDLQRVARQVFSEGKTKFLDFQARMKEIFGDAWNKIKGIIKNLWADLKKIASDETGAITIRDYSPEILSRMSRTLKAKGYDVRGADDVKALLEKGHVFKDGKFTQSDWQEAYDKAIGSVSKRKATKKAAEAKRSDFKNVNWKRITQLGITGDIREAGYITPSGSYVDLSGKREGGQPGERSFDHREAGGTDGMQEIMAYGYIRMDANSGAIDIAKEPTPQQYDKLYGFFEKDKGEIALDLEDGLGEYSKERGNYNTPERHFSKYYEAGTKPQRIINDIKTFFRGDMPVEDTVSNLRERLLSETGFIDISSDLYPPLRDLARRVYAQGHQTFSQFAREMRRILGEAWSKVRRVMKQLWADVKAKATEERGSISLEKKEPSKATMAQEKPTSGPEWAKAYMANLRKEAEAEVAKIEKAGNPFGGSENGNNTDKAREALHSRFNAFMYWVVDKNRPIQVIQSRLSKISEEIDLFLSETQRPKVTASKVKAVWDDEIIPLLTKMAKDGIAIPDLEEYAHAMHAHEANAALILANSRRYYEMGRESLSKDEKRQLADIVKDSLGIDTIDELKEPEQYSQALNALWEEFAESDQISGLKRNWDKFSERPSGMSNAEADEVLKAYRGDAKIEDARNMLSAINDNKLEVLHDAGLLDEEEYNAIKNKYKFYVPLYREGYVDSGFGTGKGIQPAGRPIKTRMGSTRNVVHIMGHSISNYENAINRAEKAASARVFMDLIKANPDPDLWRVQEVKKSPTHDKYGNIRMYPDLFNVAPNEMRIMVDGQQHLIEVNKDNKDAMLMLKTLKAEDSMSGPFVNALLKVNKWLSRVNTSYSPEFILSNFMRDLQTAGINIQDTGVESKRLFRGALEAAKAIYSVERGNAKGTNLEAMYGRFKTAGGKIGWNDIHGSIENLSKKISAELDMMAGKAPIRKNLTELVRWIDDANTSIENGVRLHTFKLAVDQGMTDKKAAQIASDLTVDFTRKGAAGPAINALYLFANAGIQGNYRLIRALSKSHKVQGIMAGIIGTGLIVSILNSALGGKDDDDEDYYNKIDDYVRERNMIFMLPGTKGRYAKIPLPWGYNFFWNLGDEIGKVFTRENYRPLAGAGRLASVFAGAFNPIQSGTLLQTLAPTVLDPFAMVRENKNWFGGDLMPSENKFDKTPTPDNQRYWKSASSGSKWVANQLGNLTGGNKVRPGMIDVSPETLDLIIDSAGGSMIRFFKDIVETPVRLIRKEETQMQQYPFIRRIAGQKSEWADSRIYRENVEEVLYAKEELKAYRGTPYYDDLSSNLKRQKRMIPFAENTEKYLSRMRKLRNAYDAKGQKEQVKKADKVINSAYIKFNKRFNQEMATNPNP